jgi:uncharacterized membrane protein YfcA
MIAYALATFIGLSLGMLGGGGSILAVPVLIYVLNFPPKVAIASSLAIVGLASLVGVWRHHQQGNVEFKRPSLLLLLLCLAPFWVLKFQV